MIRRLSDLLYRLALCCVCLSLLLSAQLSLAAEGRGFVDRVYRDDDGAHKYAVFVPRNYSPNKKWPVILFLHGAGERGTDGLRQTTAGLGPVVKLRVETFPFLVVFPQCEDVGGRVKRGWLADSPDGKRALKILNEVERDYSVDPKRRILTGWSMGGFGTWSIAAANPDRFSAVVPVSGGGDPAAAAKLKGVPVWTLHGEDDRAVQPAESQQMVDALRAAGGRPRLTIVPEIGHDVWKVVYDGNLLINWMLDPRQGGTPEPTAFQADPERLEMIDGEFLPAVEIPKAMFVRIGNRALKAASYSIPSAVPADALSGRIDDMSDSTVSEGRTFSVYLSRISYRAKLSRALIQVPRKDRVRIQLGLSNATLTIGQTNVIGNRRSAVAGPMQVVLGHRQPVWLNLDVLPYVQDRKLKLKLLERSFEIPDDNWYVSGPAGVSTDGLGMTADRVSSGLVSGMYGNKHRIEGEILQIVPSLIKQIEEKLQVDEVSSLVGSFWPLPVYQPRLRVWPDEVAVDENGISLSLSITAASVEPGKAPKTPRRFEPQSPALEKLPRGNDLQIGLAPNVLNPLTQLLVDADLARINVLDIPNDAFAPFADRKTLEEAVPDLKSIPKDAEIRAELVLRSPISVRTAPRDTSLTSSKEDRPGSIEATNPDASNTGTTSSGSFTFVLPEITIAVSIKENRQRSRWMPYAEFQYALEQPMAVDRLAPDFETRKIRIQWAEGMTLSPSARFADSYKPGNPEIRLEILQDLFSRGWRTWTTSDPVADATVPDLDLGYSKLRLQDVELSAPHLLARFGEPGVKISNGSEQPLVYETRGPFSPWGGPYTLEPGGSHEFAIAYPLLFRRKVESGYRVFSLPVGSHSDFRVPKSGGAPQLFQARKVIANELNGEDVRNEK